jgi:GTP-binding protein Era
LKSAVIGVVGRTNAGKSTIVNRLVGEKVSIVSPVEQTTRNTIRGIVADPRGQLVLLDTPGLHKAVGPLGKILNGMARASSAGVDVLLVVFDAAREPQLEDGGWMARVAKERPEKLVFALNKYDRKTFNENPFRELWAKTLEESAVKMKESGRMQPGEELPPCNPIWVKSAAVRPDGCAELLDALFEFAPEGEPLFPEDIVTDYPRKLAIADVIREKFLSRLHDEIPHELGIAVRDIVEKRGTWEVSADVYVNRPSQKGIVIGQCASNLKYVRHAAEPELSDAFGVKVRLELWVKVEPGWMKNGRLLAEMGYAGSLQ